MQAQLIISIDGHIREANQEAQRLLRATRAQLVGNHFTQVVVESDLARDTIKLALVGGLPVDCPLRFRDREGNAIDAFVNTAVQAGPTGVVDSVSVSFKPRDESSDALLAAIVRSAGDAILSATLEGKIITWNTAATSLFGYNERDILGTHLSQLFACERSDIDNLFKTMTTAARISPIELKRQHHAGQQKFLSIEFSRVLAPNGELIGVSAICRDVTMEKMQIENIATEFKTIVQTNKMLTQHASELSRQAAQMELFAEMAGLLQVCETEEEVFFLLARIAAKLYPNSAGMMYATSDKSDMLSPVGNWGHARDPRPLSRTECIASHRAESHLSTVYGEDHARCAHLPDRDGTYLCAPLILSDELLGVMSVHWQAPEIVADTPALAARLLGDAALAMANLKLRKQLQQLAIRDGLTNLYNRRHMEEFLSREMVRCKRKHLPLSLIMFDVDHFKLFNDEHGHYAGDAVLREVGRLTHQMVRASDIGCRYGGEEFLLVMPELDLDSAVQRAELIRRTCEELHVSYAGMALPTVTLSLGVAGFPTHAETAEEVIGYADAALYSAKRLGRNRVVLASKDELNNESNEPRSKTRA